MQGYFVRMQSKNSNFYQTMYLDYDFRIRNVLWVDISNTTTYKSFNDVVTFHTTYLTKKYEMLFGLFVGVNQHKQSILCGCGLLSNENTYSFCL
jgi:zinc finger SWIM domain-containing protein 3